MKARPAHSSGAAVREQPRGIGKPGLLDMDAIDLLLRFVGAFYVFAAYVGARASLMSLLIDRAIAAIALEKPARADLMKSYWLLAASVIVMAGGAALLFLLDIAMWAFLASAVGQAVYLFYVAPRYFDAEDPPDAVGRRQSVNAFVIYLIATAFVVWAASAGRLWSVADVSWPLLAIPAAMVAAHVVYVLWMARKPAAGGGAGGFGGSPFGNIGDDPPRPLSETKVVKVMADYYTHPLWALDKDLDGDIAPEEMGLSPELTQDLNDWAAAYNTSLNHEDPANSLWSDEQLKAHDAMARPLAKRLARERPDLTVYVLEPGIGVVEVHAEDGA